MSEEARRIGARMRELREALPDSPSQAAMAAQLPGNVQGAEWSRWETGRHRPHSDTLDAIATLLGTTPADLMLGATADRVEQPPPSGSPLDALSAPLAQADLADRLDRIEAALALLLADRGLQADDPPSEQGRPRRDGS